MPRLRKGVVSRLHNSLRKKRTRLQCQTCGKDYEASHYRQHTTTCANRLTQETENDRQNADEQEDRPTDDDSGDEDLQGNLHSAMAQHLHRFVHEQDFTGEIRATHEVWENVSFDDVEQDVGDQIVIDDAEDKSDVSSMWLVIGICIFLCTLQTVYSLPDVVLSSVLSFIKSLFSVLGKESAIAATVAATFPGTLYVFWKTLGFKRDNFRKYVICPKCHTLYLYNDCVINIEGVKTSRKCSHVAFPNHPQLARRRPCGETLLLSVTTSNGKTLLYPYKSYCYKSIIERFKSFLKRPGFVTSCAKWRDRQSTVDVYTDVYDGRIWKEFQSEKHNYFLNNENNYALMLNLDWFQPFEHVSYSVGVFYAVVLNLPREERFKLKNVLLVGIIPDMGKEPSCVAPFVTPLAEELKIAWADGILATTSVKKEPVLHKLALLCVGCDIPASRKLAGFLGHTATLGCSRCLKRFEGGVGNKDYSGFDREQWILRTKDDHMDRVAQVLAGRTQTEKEQLERTHGVRFSPLLELTYFDPIRMSIIDPMHNMFQGTAKRIIKVWVQNNVLTEDIFHEVQQEADSIATPSNIGRIPRKISSAFGGFTADQWKNWVNIFALLALRKSGIEAMYYRNLRLFVIASRIMCSRYLKETDIELFDQNILQFCEGFQDLFGGDVVTPNMHLHGHMAECLRDYGPVYSFWLFSFERYNGQLGALPNNNRSVEVQFMRRFLRDSFVNSVQVPEEFNEYFGNAIASLGPRSNAKILDDSVITDLLNKGDPGVNLRNQNWFNIEMYELLHVNNTVLEEDEIARLRRMYAVLYPDIIMDCSFPPSVRRCRGLKLGREIIGTVSSRLTKSALIMANWCAGDGKIVDSQDTDIRPGLVNEIYVHNLLYMDEVRPHIILKISWYMRYQDALRHKFGELVEIWPREMFEMDGEAMFMPAQRVFCKFAFHSDKVQNRNVMCITPLHKRIDV